MCLCGRTATDAQRGDRDCAPVQGLGRLHVCSRARTPWPDVEALLERVKAFLQVGSRLPAEIGNGVSRLPRSSATVIYERPRTNAAPNEASGNDMAIPQIKVTRIRYTDPLTRSFSGAQTKTINDSPSLQKCTDPNTACRRKVRTPRKASNMSRKCR
jgi:hypothetical protein